MLVRLSQYNGAASQQLAELEFRITLADEQSERQLLAERILWRDLIHHYTTMAKSVSRLLSQLLSEAEVFRLEMRRGACTVFVDWPVQEAQACGAWLREWLR